MTRDSKNREGGDKAAREPRGEGRDREDKQNVWDRTGPEEREAIEAYARDYMGFLSEGKTERKVYGLVLEALRAAGLKDLEG
ncbi:MAG: hypothetical protein LBG06_10985, partial [Deltaproteobacteria bacterium]|nr:hypothetical protein [Deltaproteobacteria bacterium]